MEYNLLAFLLDSDCNSASNPNGGQVVAECKFH